MSIDFLTTELNNIANAKRENRERVANIVLENTDLIKDLIAITFDVDNKTSIKAAWILEWVCTHNGVKNILPYLDTFTNNISALQFDSAIRPCAKICEQLAEAYFSKSINTTNHKLKGEHISKIVETGFDWLITPQKIAVRAYTMNTLYLFGLEQDWIHPELKHLIETKIIHESKGCKARGKHILKLIEKHQKTA
ncbi:MAG: adenylosuccinate lyase [Flavobacteriaceae bacterium]|nr:adenylosuccinate lyase [Flavobacteriaceae bacterium]